MRHLKQSPRQSLVSFGPLFENTQALDKLRNEGLKDLSSLESLTPENTVALPVWGTPAEDLASLRNQGIPLLNTTCPRDSLAHNLAYRLAREGYAVIIVGRADSPPSKALMSRVEKGRREQMQTLGETLGRAFSGVVIDATCGKDPDLRCIPEDVTHVAIVAQANASLEAYQRVVAKAAMRFEEVRAYNTICPSLSARFQEAVRLSALCEAILIIGDKTMETEELGYLCSKTNSVKTYHISGSQDLPDDLHEKFGKVGVISSTATPDWLLVSIVEDLRRWSDANVEEGPAMG